jgi:hypothetical protein
MHTVNCGVIQSTWPWNIVYADTVNRNKRLRIDIAAFDARFRIDLARFVHLFIRTNSKKKSRGNVIIRFRVNGNLCHLFYSFVMISTGSKNLKNPPPTFSIKRASVIHCVVSIAIRFIEFSDHECKCYLEREFYVHALPASQLPAIDANFYRASFR